VKKVKRFTFGQPKKERRKRGGKKIDFNKRENKNKHKKSVLPKKKYAIETMKC